MDIDDIHSDGRYGESATISRSFIPAKYSTLITEFSIYKLSSDLQRMDVRRYNGVFVTRLLQTRNSENFAYKVAYMYGEMETMDQEQVFS